MASSTSTNGVAASTLTSDIYVSPPKLPDWVPDESVLDCACCAQRFTVTLRRHHCRRCGKVVCNPCSRHKSTFPKNGIHEPVRICVECYCDIMAQKRGIRTEPIAAFIRSQIDAARPVNTVKIGIHSRIAAIGEEMRVKESELISAAKSSDGLDLTSYQDSMNRLAKDAGTLQEELTKLRLAEGLVVTVSLPTKNANHDFWTNRYLVITPSPRSYLVLTGLINGRNTPHSPQAAAPLENKNGISFHFIHTLDEIATVRPTSITYPKSDVKYHGVLLSWANDIMAASIATPTNSLAASGGSARAPPSSLPGMAPAPTAAPAKSQVPSSMVAPPPPKEDMKFILIESLESKDRRVSAAINNGNSGNGDDSKNGRRSGTGPSLGLADTEWNLQAEVLQTLHAHKKLHFERTKLQTKLVEEWQTDMKTHVSWEDESHAILLRRLWKSYQPTVEYPGGKHELWKTIGFQGTDPITDFRGMGVLSLKVLVYMGETHPELILPLVAAQATRNYPLCAAGINVVSMIADLLTIRQPSGYTKPLTSNALFAVFARASHQYIENSFAELCTRILMIIDRVFVAGNCTYFQFGAILSTVRLRVAAALTRSPHQFSSLIRMIDRASPEGRINDGSSEGRDDDDYLASLTTPQVISPLEDRSSAIGAGLNLIIDSHAAHGDAAKEVSSPQVSSPPASATSPNGTATTTTAATSSSSPSSSSSPKPLLPVGAPPVVDDTPADDEWAPRNRERTVVSVVSGPSSPNSGGHGPSLFPTSSSSLMGASASTSRIAGSSSPSPTIRTLGNLTPSSSSIFTSTANGTGVNGTSITFHGRRTIVSPPRSSPTSPKHAPAQTPITPVGAMDQSAPAVAAAILTATIGATTPPSSS